MAGKPVGHWSWSIDLHRKLLSDPIRNKSFHSVLKKTVKRDSIIVDIGSGLGFMGFLVC